MQKIGLNGSEGDTQREQHDCSLAEEPEEKGRPWIRLDQNMVFFRRTTNPGIFVRVQMYGMKEKGAFVQTRGGANETQVQQR